jgi:hypothetical protein
MTIQPCRDNSVMTQASMSTPTTFVSAGSTPPSSTSPTQSSVAVPQITPTPQTASDAGGGAIIGAIVSGAFLAAMVAGAINVWMARRKSREEERARVRDTFAAAFAAYTAYKEFPYAIRRRRADIPEEERVRLSESLRTVQERLSYYLAWTKAESSEVGDEYANLIGEARRVAGRAMHNAWNDPPRGTDSEMNIPAEVVDLSVLAAREDQYMRAVYRHLSNLTPWWAR